uniref:Probable queuosine precursor transporter n=1 Tax=Candidatus Kentrum sp. LFY TaxID=2126342 RepID=A0A450UGJ0_9GAMM|nr:MAG: hypothetical protein BECKLFY1418B_GA0070995_102714 [Candidatus Kentron sp. LFY]
MTLTKSELEKLQPLLLLLTAIFSGVLICGVALGSKLIGIAGVIASASALTYPVTFLITDTVAEIWGKDHARRLVINGFFVLVAGFVIIQIILLIPGSDVWKNEEGFNETFGLSLRLILAGTIAYLISQVHDVWAFHFWKKLTKGKHLWIRNNASTSVSQLIDTAIFVGLGFGGIVPFWDVFVGQFILKVSFALCDTPFVYILVAYIRKRYNVHAHLESPVDSSLKS